MRPNEQDDYSTQTSSILAFILSPQIVSLSLKRNDPFHTRPPSFLAIETNLNLKLVNPKLFQESWMDVVNPFILKNKIGMVKFVDELCNIELVDPEVMDNTIIDCNNNGSPSELFESGNPGLESAQDLAIVHDICEKYRKDLEQQANVSQAARRLVTTLNMLSKHKQYYMNLRRQAQKSANML